MPGDSVFQFFVDGVLIDIDTAGTGAKGLIVSFEFEKAAI